MYVVMSTEFSGTRDVLGCIGGGGGAQARRSRAPYPRAEGGNLYKSILKGIDSGCIGSTEEKDDSRVDFVAWNGGFVPAHEE